MSEQTPPAHLTEGAATTPDLSFIGSASHQDSRASRAARARNVRTVSRRDPVPDVKHTAQVPTQQSAPQAAKPKDPPVIKKEPPKGVLIPRTGWRAWKYRWYVKHNKADKVPTPNRRDRIDCLERELRYLVNELQITICFANMKGGASKTTTAVYIGLLLAHVTNKVFYLLPATNNTSTSTTALNAGIAREDTLTMTQFAQLFRELGTYRAVSKRVPTTPEGLRVISEDSEETVTISSGFNREMFMAVSGTLHDSVDGMLFDTGNDAITPGSVVLEAAHRADVMVFTATADKQMTLEKLETTIGTYMTDLRNDKNVLQGRRVEAEIPTYDKAAQSVVVISGTKPGTKPEAFLPYTTKRDKKGRTISSIGWSGKLMTVPRDPFMANNIKYTIKNIGPDTYEAYLLTAIAIYRQAASLRGVHVDFDPNADL